MFIKWTKRFFIVAQKSVTAYIWRQIPAESILELMHLTRKANTNASSLDNNPKVVWFISNINVTIL